MDYKLELVLLPVADVERAKAFYAEQVGFAVSADFADPDGNVWVLQEKGHGA